jgi:hypothetical protein
MDRVSDQQSITPGTDAVQQVSGKTANMAPKSFTPCVSVIIVSYWTGPLLARSVISAARQHEVAEVIVVDNGNAADDMARLRDLAGENGDKLNIITGHGNVGYAAGCNMGVRHATCDYVFILNPDAILPDNAVAQLLTQSTELEGNWLIGARLINPDGTEQAGSRRNPLTPWTAFVELTRIDKLAPRHPYFRRFNHHQAPCPKKICEIPVVSGACMLMPKAAYQSIDGMDEEYFLHVEDVDFCLRLRKAGGQVYFTPEPSILHFKSSSRVSKLDVEYWKAKSLIRYFWTHFRKPYPYLFLVLVSAMVWLSFGVKALIVLAKRMVRVFGHESQARVRHVKRARRMAAQRARR